MGVKTLYILLRMENGQMTSDKKDDNTFSLCESIPRGAAICRGDVVKNKKTYYGGRPRCPVCFGFKQVNHNGYNLVVHYGASILGFHCNRCRVWWYDSNYALCFICNREFLVPNAPTVEPHLDYRKEGHSIMYHHNSINFPFCIRCQEIVGSDRTSNRSGLRKLVGV